MKLPDCLSIDPGPDGSGLVRAAGGQIAFKSASASVDDFAREIGLLRHGDPVLIEGMSSYGSQVGDSTILSCYLIGRLWQIASDLGARPVIINRVEVRYALLGGPKGSDSIVNGRVKEMFGGPQETKKGGKLNGVVSHAWAALALICAYARMAETGNVKAVRMP